MWVDLLLLWSTKQERTEHPPAGDLQPSILACKISCSSQDLIKCFGFFQFVAGFTVVLWQERQGWTPHGCIHSSWIREVERSERWKICWETRWLVGRKSAWLCSLVAQSGSCCHSTGVTSHSREGRDYSWELRWAHICTGTIQTSVFCSQVVEQRTKILNQHIAGWCLEQLCH